MLDRNKNYWFNKFYNANTIDLAIDDPVRIQDTYITNTLSDTKVLAFDRKAQNFIELNDVVLNEEVASEEFAGGKNRNTLYQNRTTLKIGGTDDSTYRGVLIFNIRDSVEDAVSAITGYTAGMEYSILHANITLTSSEGQSGGVLQAFMLATGASTDESTTWTKPSQAYETTWTAGGEQEPLSAGVISTGSWNGHDATFDITPFFNIWKSSGKDTLEVAVKTDETSPDVLQFHSQQAASPLLGAKLQSNVVFYGAGDSNSINTEGVVVKISQQLPYLTLENAETETSGTNRWSAFNASVSVGNTFSMFLPDIKGTASTYTLIDKRSGDSGVQMIISGDTAGFSSTVHTTAEFSCTGTVATGLGIVEFASPDNSLLTDLSTLNPNDTVIFGYTPTISPNNAKSYTVDFYSDERTKNNRVRLYTKEATASENRSGLNTEVKRVSVRPRLNLTLSV
jgi:hypothetical protein